MHPVGREGSIITENEALKNLKQILENYINTTPPKYYPPVESLLDLNYETYTENNPAAPKTTVAGRAAKAKEKEFEAWLREIPGMDRLFVVSEKYGNIILVPEFEDFVRKAGFSREPHLFAYH